MDGRKPLGWYRIEDFSRMRGLVGTAVRSYDEWRDLAEARERELQASGIEVVRVYVDPDDFVEWCEREGRETDPAALDAFVRTLDPT